MAQKKEIRNFDPATSSDADFIAACKSLQGLSLADRLKIIFANQKLAYLFTHATREIKGKYYSYGIRIFDYEQAQLIGNFFVKQLKRMYYMDRMKNFLERANGADVTTLTELIKIETEEDQQKLKAFSENPFTYKVENPFRYGYESERKRDYNLDFEDVIRPINFQTIKDTKFNADYCCMVAQGAAAFLVETNLKLTSQKTENEDHDFNNTPLKSYINGDKVTRDKRYKFLDRYRKGLKPKKAAILLVALVKNGWVDGERFFNDITAAHKILEDEKIIKGERQSFNSIYTKIKYHNLDCEKQIKTYTLELSEID